MHPTRACKKPLRNWYRNLYHMLTWGLPSKISSLRHRCSGSRIISQILFACSNIVYIYKCGICNSRYIGETSRHYTTRVAEHMGVSPRTGAPMARINSNVYSHFLESGHRIKKEDFSILYSRGSSDLRLSESIAIHQHRPDLNDKVASVPLEVLCM